MLVKLDSSSRKFSGMNMNQKYVSYHHLLGCPWYLGSVDDNPCISRLDTSDYTSVNRWNGQPTYDHQLTISNFPWTSPSSKPQKAAFEGTPSPPPDFFMVGNSPTSRSRGSRPSIGFVLRSPSAVLWSAQKGRHPYTQLHHNSGPGNTSNPLYIYSLNSRGHYRTPTQTRHY